ncbi:MAG: hypothetical protein J7L89_10160 [Bacteroidales bacterium]|nr:hypothetical protein [Bacteroidales bacterium]
MKKSNYGSTYHNRRSGLPDSMTEQMFSTFAGIRPNGRSRLGGEFNFMNNLNNIRDLKSYGFYVYGAYSLSKILELFTRFDRLNYVFPQDHQVLLNSEAGTAIRGGISCSPIKGLDFSLNYQGWIPDHSGEQVQNRIIFSTEYKF